MPAPNTKTVVDFNDDGDFDDANEDISNYVLLGPGIVLERGKDSHRQISAPMAGHVGLVLNNLSRLFSPGNLSSPLNSLLEPGKMLQVQIQPDAPSSLVTEDGDIITTEDSDVITTEEATYIPFGTGRTDAFEQRPAYGIRQVALSCTGNLGRLVGLIISTPVYQDISVSQAIGYLLDAAGWPAEDRNIQDSISTLTWYWIPQMDAFEALKLLLYSEGPGASIYEDAAGRLVFENRHSRLTESRSINSQFTFQDTDYIQRDLSYEPHTKDIINEVSFDLEEREIGAIETLWELDTPLVLAPNESRTILVSGSDPIIDAIVPLTTDGQNEVQILQANDDAAAFGVTGSYQLGFGGEQTTAVKTSTPSVSSALGIATDDSDVAIAMQQLSTIGWGNLTVSGELDTGMVFTFIGDLATTPMELMSVSSNLVGSGEPALTIRRSVPGRKHGIVLSEGALASVSFDRTSGEFITMTVTADTDGATIQSIRVRGRALKVTKQYRITNSIGDAELKRKYGAHSYPNRVLPWLEPNVAQTLADMVVYFYQNPRASVRFTCWDSDTVARAYQVRAEISDLNTVVEPHTGINDPYYLEWMRHELSEYGIKSEFGLEQAYPSGFDPADFARIGTWEIGAGIIAY